MIRSALLALALLAGIAPVRAQTAISGLPQTSAPQPGDLLLLERMSMPVGQRTSAITAANVAAYVAAGLASSGPFQSLGAQIAAETSRAQAAESLAAQRAANLSDLASAPSARSNLGLAAVAASGSASDLGAGTLPAGRLPVPTTTTLGGVQAATAPANTFGTGISVSGLPTFAQPSFSNLSGSATAAQMPAFTGDIATSAGSTVTTIGAGTVTNAKLATVPAGTLKGNAGGSAAAPSDLTTAQVKTLLGYAASGANSDITSLTGLSTIGVSGNASIGGVVTISGSLTSGDALYVNDRSVAGHRSAVYRNSDTTRLWDYSYGDTITYDTAGNVTIPGTLSLATPLARTSGGTGATSLSGGFDLAYGATQGSVLYRGASSWTALGPGTAGQVLASGGPNANPAWQAGGGNGTVTSVATGAGLTGGPITSSGTIAVQNVGSQPVNAGLAATVASNALTVALTGNNGAAPSTSNIVQLPFRDPTLSAGDWKWVTVTAPLSVTALSGATLGTANGAPFRFWVVALYNGGSPMLGLIDCSDGANTIFPLNEGALVSSTAISSSSTSAGTIYAPSAVSGSPYLILGYLEYGSGLTTAGSYASAPPILRLFGSGMKRPGEPVQFVQVARTAASNNNINTYGAGAQAATITLTSAANAVDASVAGGDAYVSAAGVLGYLRIARGNTAAGVTVSEMAFGGSAGTIQVPGALRGLDFPATTSATVYGVQIKNSDNSTNVVYPQTGRTSLILTEIQG